MKYLLCFAILLCAESLSAQNIFRQNDNIYIRAIEQYIKNQNRNNEVIYVENNKYMFSFSDTLIGNVKIEVIKSKDFLVGKKPSKVLRLNPIIALEGDISIYISDYTVTRSKKIINYEKNADYSFIFSFNNNDHNWILRDFKVIGF